MLGPSSRVSINPPRLATGDGRQSCCGRDSEAVPRVADGDLLGQRLGSDDRHRVPGLKASAAASETRSQFDPGRRVIAGLFPTAHLPVNIRRDQTRGQTTSALASANQRNSTGRRPLMPFTLKVAIFTSPVLTDNRGGRHRISLRQRLGETQNHSQLPGNPGMRPDHLYQ